MRCQRQLEWQNFRLDELKELRDAISNCLADVSLKNDWLEEIVLAVDEAVTNIIMHGYQGQEGFVKVCLTLINDKLTIEILDQAPEFDVTQGQKQVDVLQDARFRVGGFGISLIYANMDEILWRMEQGQNLLTLVKRLN